MASDGCGEMEGTEKAGLAELGWEGLRSGGAELELSCRAGVFETGPAVSIAGAAFRPHTIRSCVWCGCCWLVPRNEAVCLPVCEDGGRRPGLSTRRTMHTDPGCHCSGPDLGENWYP